ncbi:MAG: hypothetical protein DMF65_04155 [Acidobacteria bacterium]|nr:MAG: hypothetical protein DMF65_04155 [Acidobacteriota bacterium]
MTQSSSACSRTRRSAVRSSVADVGGDLSDDRLRFVPAASVSLEEYAAGFTASFVGYHFNLTLDAARLARKIRVEQHDLQHSLVAYEGEELVGVAALAIRGEAGWVGGFGVVPRRRGRGLGRLLMAALLEQARACRLRRLTLEVLAQNAAARRLYEGAGMRVTRDLLILARAVVAGKEADAVGGGPSKVEESDSSNTDSLNNDSSKSGWSKSDSSGSLKSDSSTSDSLKEAAPAELLSHFARLPRRARAAPRLRSDVGRLGRQRLRLRPRGGRRRDHARVVGGAGARRVRVESRQRAGAQSVRRAAARARLRRDRAPARDVARTVGVQSSKFRVQPSGCRRRRYTS